MTGYLVHKSICVDKELDSVIRLLSSEMNQIYSETVRGLVKVAIAFLLWLDYITHPTPPYKTGYIG